LHIFNFITWWKITSIFLNNVNILNPELEL
jgi:hypothetical protein